MKKKIPIYNTTGMQKIQHLNMLRDKVKIDVALINKIMV